MASLPSPVSAAGRLSCLIPRLSQVTGGPGTGKTVVALHRVKHLLARYPDHRILLTTFTNALADTLRANLSLLLGVDTLPPRLEVSTVNAYAYRTVQQLSGRAPAPIGDVDERQLWRRVQRRLGLPWAEQFLQQEYRHVILAQNLRTREEYRAAARRGRGRAIGAPQRDLIWDAVEAFHGELSAAGKTTQLRMCATAAELVDGAKPAMREFQHVVVDEAQDLHPMQWRLLRAAVAPGPDDLFLTGDPHQRIYDNRVSLASVGISVAGRSSRLRLNYRNTEEILSWSAGLMHESPVADLEGQGSDTLAGYRSLLHGRRPHISGYASEQEEVAALVARCRSGWPAGSTAARSRCALDSTSC